MKSDFASKPTLVELSKFDLGTYAKLLRYLGQTYKIVPFSDLPKENCRYLILRHDVDISLEPALKMAQLEHEMGIRSSYFILLSSKQYNCFEGRNAGMIKQILALNHEIGLHYDSNQYRRYNQDIINALRMEIQTLENLTGNKVCSISCHAPSSPNSFLRLPGYINADDNRLKGLYVHDSRRIWTVRSLSVLLNDSPEKVQLLIHPCHWVRIMNSRFGRLDTYLSIMLSLLYKLRTAAIRLLHSKESCEN